MKWSYLTTVPDQTVAEMWRNLLHSEGIAAAIRQGDTSSFMGVSIYPCRIVVQEYQLKNAQEALEGHLSKVPK